MTPNLSITTRRLVACVIGACCTVPILAHADVWQVSLQNAKHDAHYLINTKTASVTSMRNQQCIRSYTAKIEGEKTSAPKVIVESEISGGGAGGGTRGTQRMEFILREGTTTVTMSSTVRGDRPPLAATARKTCTGAACAMTSC
jgi:hypothetical protein